ncbi:DUF2061 domain-containing protein [Psychroserpens damuponensis]|uniref:DUF2061 domain-containing protein n=1 Tax=Psychroserpens damuponensis TaxID=943936 RepID=UPI000A06A035|nr:DUF2061 domain-containing protein [Psychroserpens damuponensis]
MNTILNRSKVASVEEQTYEAIGDKIKKILVKTISWRVLGALVTIVITYFITRTK